MVSFTHIDRSTNEMFIALIFMLGGIGLESKRKEIY